MADSPAVLREYCITTSTGEQLVIKAERVSYIASHPHMAFLIISEACVGAFTDPVAVYAKESLVATAEGPTY